MYKDVCIEERQNTEESIQYLRAQRYAYKIAKQSYIARMILSVFWPIIAVIMYFIFENKFANWILIISSLILVITFLMELYEKKYTKIGATIQEQFDTNVFGMKWNLALVGEKISEQQIYILAKKEKTDKSKLIDWYTGIDTNDEIQYTLKAQRTNTYWSIRQYVDFSQQVNELKRITVQLNALLESERTTKYQLRCVQDAIYIHGRVPNNIISDILYNKLRKKLEEIFKNTNK